jgi:hypothetical protein
MSLMAEWRRTRFCSVIETRRIPLQSISKRGRPESELDCQAKEMSWKSQFYDPDGRVFCGLQQDLRQQ